MTQEELSLEEYRFSRVIATPEERAYLKDQPAEADLEAYLQDLFHLEPFPTYIKELEPTKSP